MFDFDFGLGEDIDLLRETVRSFAVTEIAPRAAEIDRSNAFPMDLWRKFGDLGLLLGCEPREHLGRLGGRQVGQHQRDDLRVLVLEERDELPHVRVAQ